MKIFNLVKLGYKKISENKKRSVLTIVAIGVLSGVMCGAIFLFQGLENRLIKESLNYTSGKVYLLFGGCADIEACESPDETMAKANEYAEKYNGVVEGEIAHYFYQENGLPNAVTTIPDEFEPFLNLSETEMKKDVPFFSNVDNDFSLFGLALTSIEKRVWSLSSSLTPESDGNSVLASIDKEKKFTEPILSFNTIDDAMSFYLNEICIKTNSSSCFKTRFRFQEFFGNALSVKISFTRMFEVFKKVEIILGIIVLVIMIFTFLRIIQENSKTIALYLALGAKKKDVFLIYLFFLINLCVITGLFAILLGAIISISYSALNASKVSGYFSAVYLSEIKVNYVIGYNPEILRLVLILLISAPIASILTIDQLSPKNTAKNIKK